jgi:hypothetical protein
MVELHSKGGANDSDQISQVGTADDREGREGIKSWHQFRIAWKSKTQFQTWLIFIT